MDLITIHPEPGGLIKVRIRKHEIAMERSPAEGGQDGAVSPVEMIVPYTRLSMFLPRSAWILYKPSRGMRAETAWKILRMIGRRPKK